MAKNQADFTLRYIYVQSNIKQILYKDIFSYKHKADIILRYIFLHKADFTLRYIFEQSKIVANVL